MMELSPAIPKVYRKTCVHSLVRTAVAYGCQDGKLYIESEQTQTILTVKCSIDSVFSLRHSAVDSMLTAQSNGKIRTFSQQTISTQRSDRS